VELLESRQLLSVAIPTFVRASAVPLPSPLATSGSAAYTPGNIRHIYGFDQLSYTGSGQTIAIIDAYDAPNLASDLHTFDTRFGLPDPSFRKVAQDGSNNLPGTDPSGPGGSNWEAEEALDVDWAHAIAPGANILLVEANSNNFSDLLTAVDFAARQPGVVAVSMSWGSTEFSGENSFDSHFLSPARHAGVTFIASAGDTGGVVDYPAVAANVLAIGGTSLFNSGGNYASESAWPDGGGGVSAVEAVPAFQAGLGYPGRATPDVAYDADPNTGVYVYDSYNGGWFLFGGTSAGAPQWAGLMALVAQGRAQQGLAPLNGASQTLSALYQVPRSDFHDVTSGSAGSHAAGPGFDLATGLGSPVANRLIPDLVNIFPQATNSATHFALTAISPVSANAPFTITLTALDASNNVAIGYTGTVHFTSSDSAAILPANYQFGSADSGVHSFTVTLVHTGTQTVTSSDTAKAGITGAVSISVASMPIAGAGLFANGQWLFDSNNSNPATTVAINNFGSSGDIAVTGDWLGNGKTYIGVFRPSTGSWYLSTTNTDYSPANTIQLGNFGAPGDIPVVGHWGSNPAADYVGVFRPSTGQWFLDQIQGSYNPATTIQINFGAAGDKPVVGNWGKSTISDGRSYVGIFRPSTGQWFLDEVEGDYNPRTTIRIDNFGASGDVPQVGNWLGGAQDGHTYIGVFRPGTGQWFLSKSNASYTAANTIQIGNFGGPGDIAAVGDWLGSGLTEVGVFRPNSGQWFFSKTDTNYTASNTIQINNFGGGSYQPVVGAWAIPRPAVEGSPGSDTPAAGHVDPLNFLTPADVAAAFASWRP
jgi:hypothetical protein